MFDLKLFQLEFRRTALEIKRKPISFFIGVLFLFGVYFATQRFPMLKFLSDRHSSQGPIIYFAWLFCLGTTLEISNALCSDIVSGVVSKIAQSPYGFVAILRARFVASATSNFFTILILASAFSFVGVDIVLPDAKTVCVMFCLVIQCYTIMLILAGLTITQKTIGAAYLMGISIVAPLVFLPTGSALGIFSTVIPVSGSIEILKHGDVSKIQLVLLVVSTLLFVPISRYVFNRLLNRLKSNGKLLFV